MAMPNLKIKLFADGADLSSIKKMAENPLIKGFTTNPSLMRKVGVTDYKAFALEALSLVGDRSISFEVFSDDLEEMEEQARIIASWGKNVYVKIPVTNTSGTLTTSIIKRLSRDGIKLNVTAILTLDQVEDVADCLDDDTPAIISVFAGRIADTGRDPKPHMAKARHALRNKPQAELLWASPREVLNIFEANDVGCHIITATPEILSKLSLTGKSLAEFSLDTVKMFYEDAKAAGYRITTS